MYAASYFSAVDSLITWSAMFSAQLAVAVRQGFVRAAWVAERANSDDHLRLLTWRNKFGEDLPLYMRISGSTIKEPPLNTTKKYTAAPTHPTQPSRSLFYTRSNHYGGLSFAESAPPHREWKTPLRNITP